MRKGLRLFVVVCFAAVSTAHGQFSGEGYYAFPAGFNGGPYYRTASGVANNWTLDFARTQLTREAFVAVWNPAELTLDGGYVVDGVGHFSRVEVTTVSPASGLFSFTFSLTLGTPSVSQAYYLVNGTEFALSGGGGTRTISLNAGDTFGFGVDIGPQSIANQLRAEAILRVTDFSAPVPEPASVFLFVAGAAIIGVARRSRVARSLGATLPPR